jgi:uncharacterized membrane protein
VRWRVVEYVITQVMNPLSERTGTTRIHSVDSMRGVAMILVIVQHAYHLIDPTKVYGLVDFGIYGITRMASVAFIAVSGMMIAYFLYARTDWQQVQRRFAGRAVFVLLFAHPAIAVVRYFYSEGDHWQQFLTGLYRAYPITDTIALCLLVAPWILRWIKPTGLLLLIAISLLVSPLVSALWHPDSVILHILKDVLFGEVRTGNAIVVVWPLVPWLAIFLCGSFMGRELALVRTGQQSISDLRSTMRRWAIWLFAVGVVLSLGYKLLKMQFGDVWDPALFAAIYPSRLTGLLPIYLAILLWLFSLLIARIDLEGRYDRLSWAASVFGRTSLFTYIVQFFPAQTLPALLGLRYNLNLWQYLLLAAFALITTWVMAYIYGRMRGWIASDDYQRISNSLRQRKSADEA